MPSDSRSVLIVDSSSDHREVLRTVLARRGMTVFEAEAAEQGIELAREHHPDVIVLDVEADECDGACERFASQAAGHETRLIILGKVRRGATFAGGHVIRKPYHFAPLVHTIERLAAKAA